MPRKGANMFTSLLWPNHSYIEIFGIQIYWYAIIIVIGMLAAFAVISLLFKRRKICRPTSFSPFSSSVCPLQS